MNIKLIPIDVEITGAKRQQLPFNIKWDCPNCGVTIHEDLMDGDSTNYPTFGAVNTMRLYHGACDGEFEFKVRLDIVGEKVEG